MTAPFTSGAHIISHSVEHDLLSGALNLDMNGLMNAAKACTRYVDAMDHLKTAFEQPNEEHGFGRLPSGEAVGRHFIDKQLEMASVLTQYIAVAERMREVFLDAAERYAAVEDANAGMLGALDNPR